MLLITVRAVTLSEQSACGLPTPTQGSTGEDEPCRYVCVCTHGLIYFGGSCLYLDWTAKSNRKWVGKGSGNDRRSNANPSVVGMLLLAPQLNFFEFYWHWQHFVSCVFVHVRQRCTHTLQIYTHTHTRRQHLHIFLSKHRLSHTPTCAHTHTHTHTHSIYILRLSCDKRLTYLITWFVIN